MRLKMRAIWTVTDQSADPDQSQMSAPSLQTPVRTGDKGKTLRLQDSSTEQWSHSLKHPQWRTQK